ncbi:hypothetical protein SERLADRAFT_404619 [Serpula lacrymans var. lacrymans S7.9]|uniref:Uncharacterized protein n=1 Tax=Serpula lacrymans var. lacrymans (strain S7.9) TaxID=578457 RepID=F8NE77_SERL9|nr:uncharacterized protein SERLADRAFT_404619 [Serpula lacrymans var. lacrymans S7.9]EGO30459.1 hypothetical protein SERLADRAFT_404619 [Serpula lacrymans var. lacrymans S7.9]
MLFLWTLFGVGVILQVLLGCLTSISHQRLTVALQAQDTSAAEAHSSQCSDRSLVNYEASIQTASHTSFVNYVVDSYSNTASTDLEDANARFLNWLKDIAPVWDAVQLSAKSLQLAPKSLNTSISIVCSEPNELAIKSSVMAKATVADLAALIYPFIGNWRSGVSNPSLVDLTHTITLRDIKKTRDGILEALNKILLESYLRKYHNALTEQPESPIAAALLTRSRQHLFKDSDYFAYHNATKSLISRWLCQLESSILKTLILIARQVTLGCTKTFQNRQLDHDVLQVILILGKYFDIQGPRKRYCHFGRAIHVFCNVQGLIENGIRRMVSDKPEEELTAFVFLDLLKLLPGLKKHLMREDPSGEDIIHITDLIQKRVNGARSDDTKGKGIRSAVIDWIMPKEQTFAPHIPRNVKAGCSFNHKHTGTLLCPSVLDWSNTEGSLERPIKKWLIFVDQESKATRSGNARIHSMQVVTKASVAYVATQAYSTQNLVAYTMLL